MTETDCHCDECVARVDGLPAIFFPHRIGMGDHMSSAILAEFKVGPNFYHCGRVRMGQDNVPGHAKDFPVGSTAADSYDPTRMDRRVLVPGVSVGSLVFLATGISFLGLAAFAHARMRTSGPKPPYSPPEARSGLDTDSG